MHIKRIGQIVRFDLPLERRVVARNVECKRADGNLRLTAEPSKRETRTVAVHSFFEIPWSVEIGNQCAARWVPSQTFLS
jgi:hypothetical protein